MGKLVLEYRTSLKKRKVKVTTGDAELDLSADTLQVKPEDRMVSIDLTPLETHPDLQSLDLTGHTLQTLDLSPLAACQGLKRVKLGLNRLQHLDLEPLRECLALEFLDLRYNKLQTLDLGALCLHSHLEYLLLAGNPLKYLDISPLFDCKRLKHFTHAGKLFASVKYRGVKFRELPESLQLAMREVQWVKTKEDQLEEFGVKVLAFERENGRRPDTLEAYGPLGIPEDLYPEVLAYIDNSLGKEVMVPAETLEEAGQRAIAYGLEHRCIPTLAQLVLDLEMSIFLSHATLEYLENTGNRIMLEDRIRDSPPPKETQPGRCVICGKELEPGSTKCLVCGEPRYRCMLCKRQIDFNEDWVKCPHCEELAHRTHLLEWIRVKGTCPNCRQPLRPRDLD
ncbi:MAG: hypothetical protein ACFFCO_11880 [Promethearchaeota archaeon]